MMETEKCPVCNGNNFHFDRYRGEVVCRDCGLVKGRLEDEGPEWRSFDGEERWKRKRAEPSFRVRVGPRTTLEPRSTDRNGLRLKRLQKWLFSESKATLMRGFRIIQKLSSKRNLSNVIKEEAKVIYHKAVNKKLTKGGRPSPEALAAASLYVSCRILGHTIGFKEIVEGYSVDKRKGRKELRAAYKLLRNRLGLEIPPLSLRSCAERIINELNLPEEISKGVYEEIERLESRGIKWKIAGKDPWCIAAAYVLRVCKVKEYPVRPKDVAEAAGISSTGLRFSEVFLEEKIYSRKNA
jgi:transcription initiation factor TFIIB